MKHKLDKKLVEILKNSEQITETYQEMINECKEAGHGWAKFAESIEKQGWCSLKQQETLQSMCGHISFMNICTRNSGKDHPGYDNISDNEAMRSGDYF